MTLDACGDIDNTMYLLYTSVDTSKVCSYQELGIRWLGEDGYPERQVIEKD